jgi:hypothetical protein
LILLAIITNAITAITMPIAFKNVFINQGFNSVKHPEAKGPPGADIQAFFI